MAAPWAGSRRPGRNFLFVPGPTNVPDRVQRAMVVPMEDHRSSSFPELTLPLFEDLKKVFKSRDGQVFIFPSSGTGAWEAALTNTLSPGDRVLASRFGQFSTLWIDLAQRVGLDVEVQDEEWGRGADPDRIEEALRADRDHRIKAVLVVHNETATGVTSDIGAVRRAIDAAGHPAMLYVDGVSSIGSIDFRASEWGVDCAITGSQKGLMLPAGLGIVCVSPRALAAAKTAECPRCYFDFADQAKANATGYFPYTPALPLLYGLRESMRCLFEEGLEQVFARHRFLADGTRAAVKAWGLTLCAQDPKWKLGHGERHHGAGGHQRCRGDRHRLSPLQHGARRRPVEGRRQAVPHRPSRRPQRADAARGARRGRDGDVRRRHPGPAGQRRRGGADPLPARDADGRAARGGLMRRGRPRIRSGPVARNLMLSRTGRRRPGRSQNRCRIVSSSSTEKRWTPA